MSKVLKNFLRFWGILLEFILIFIILFAFIIRQSQVQTYIAQKVASYFSKELKCKLAIDKVDISFFNAIHVEGVTLNDPIGKEIVAVKSIHITIRNFGLDHLQLDKLTLSDGDVWIYKDANGKMNLSFLTEYFSSDDKETNGAPFQIELNSFLLNNAKFRFDDYRIKPNNFGFDPNHFLLKNLNLKLSKFHNKGSTLSCHIDNLNVNDVSGAQIKHLSASIAMDDLSLKLLNLKLSLPNSEINSELFQYRFRNIDDKNDFLNNVLINCKINESIISFKDLSYILTDIKGMNETIRFRGMLKKESNSIKLSNLDIRLKKNTRIKANLELKNFSYWTN